jgi:hypothetical protein
VFPSLSCDVSTISIFILFSFILRIRISIESGDAGNQNRSAQGGQLDDGIGGTFLSALLPTGEPTCGII